VPKFCPDLAADRLEGLGRDWGVVEGPGGC